MIRFEFWRCGLSLALVLLTGAVGSELLGGCAVAPANTSCTLISVMNPATAVADHASAAPGNSVQFDVGFAASPAGSSCAVPQIVYLPMMTSSDTVNVALPSPGVATCVGATPVPAILTDTKSKATAELTCK